MSLLNWSAQLDIGVAEMNHQHQDLLDLMNGLHDAYEARRDFDAQKICFLKLKMATVEHFEKEEQYMNKIQWPKLATHKVIHQMLLAEFGKHEKIFMEKRELTDDFFRFLKFWLSSHIQGIDMEYGQSVKQKKGA
jgi:hemerythrin